jgi:hypothetical protein
MSERPEPLLTDSSSFVSANGDVLPIADIQEPELPDADSYELDDIVDPDEGRSENFIKARNIIEAGIAKSANYGEYKVEFWQEGKTPRDSGRNMRMTLAEFISSNALRGMVSEDEAQELLETYREKAIERTVKRLGTAAVSEKKPVYVSGGRPYRDFQSAASNDDTLKDD